MPSFSFSKQKFLRVPGFLLRDRLFVAACTPVVAFFLLSLLFPLPDPKPCSLILHDRHGRLIHAFLATDGMWRIKTSPEDIPAKLLAMVLAREDRWFFHHPGVNPVSLVRALAQNAVAGRRVSGASTITMQVARMLEPKERTYGNKLFEMFRALQLELAYSKEQILEMYLSMVPLGGNIEGLQTASFLYYQVPLKRLTTAQLLDLILIPRDPNRLQPDRNGELLLRERMRVGRALVALQVITPDDTASFGAIPAASTRKGLPREAPHFALRVREKHAHEALVVSSLDLGLQRTAGELLAQRMRAWQKKGVPNAAIIVGENGSRSIVVYSGSPDFQDGPSRGQVDAAKARRSPGSTLKPFLYAHEMDRGLLTPRTRLLDTPYDVEGFEAENYDGSFSGLVYADEALRRSLNVPMIRMLRQAGIGSFTKLLENVGFSSLRDQRSRLGLSLILGGCGVSLEELVAGYMTFANGGEYAPLRCELSQGNGATGVRVFSSSSAYMVTEILQGLDRPDLPNNIESAMNLPAVAFKTGTSYGRRDAWTIGYSSEYTVGVWVGDVRGFGNPDLVGSKFAAPLAIDILNAISRRRSKAVLAAPSDLRFHAVCSLSGKLPGPWCRDLVDDMYSHERTVQTPCTLCREHLVSPDRRVTYCASCLGTFPYTVISVPEYPDELLHLWRQRGERIVSLPPHNPLCSRVFAGSGPVIVSPSGGMTYFVVAAQQQLCLQASPGTGVTNHFWYINREFLARKAAGEKIFVRLPGGSHTITCVDDRGRSSSIEVTVTLLNS